METETLLAISAGATFLLALAAFWAIWQNRLLQIRERKERLLNEIIEWAIDVTKGELLMEFAEVGGIKDIQRARLYLYTTVDKLHFSFRQARTRGQYISGIVSILGADLQGAVGEVVRNLEAHIQALNECRDTINSPACETTLNGATSTARKTTDSKKLLDESAIRVIEEATKIKTRDIGKKVENMSKEGEDTGGNEPTLKGIEEHLKRQDKQSAKGKYLAMSSAGVAVALVGLSLLGQGLSFLGQQYYGLILIALGLGFMLWCRWEQSKVK